MIVTSAGMLRNSTSQLSKKRSSNRACPIAIPIATPISIAKVKLTATRAKVTPTW